MTQVDRVNFSPKTKHSIAAAVNWQCSVPLCKNPAMGADDGTSINGGTACHIFSAAKNGPRGRGGLSDELLEAPSNGLWCCAYHGRVIDTNKGASFPPAQLQMWKKLAEGRVRRAMAVQFAELGWIDKLSVFVDVGPGRHWKPTITFQKNNLLRGKSGAGKTLTLEAVASISDSRHAWRLRKLKHFSAQISYETLTREGTAKIACDSAGQMWRSLSGSDTAIAPHDIKVLYLPSDQGRFQNDRGGSERLTHALGVNQDILQGLARSVSENPNSGMKVAIRADEPQPTDCEDKPEEFALAVFVEFRGRGFELPFNALSGSEQMRVASALLIALAREEVRSRPVLLCVDALWQLDDVLFRNELSKLAEEHIQLLVVAPYDVSDDQMLRDFPGWQAVDIPSIDEMFAP